MLELKDITNTIIHEIEVLRLTQSQVAITYALAIKSSDKVDWHKINAAIIKRWSMSGLNRVKTMAWKGLT